jgi:hypothetical protein
MKTTTTTKKPAAGTNAATPRPKIDRKTEKLDLLIPSGDLAIFTAFADHFGLTPEMVMEAGIMGQLGAMEDCTISTLAFHGELPPVADPVAVRLSFIPEAFALLHLVASLLRRPLEELAANLLREDVLCYAGDMETAEKMGGFDNCHELVSTARRVSAAEFEARRGRMVKTGPHDWDAWNWLNLDRYRPSRILTAAR